MSYNQILVYGQYKIKPKIKARGRRSIYFSPRYLHDFLKTLKFKKYFWYTSLTLLLVNSKPKKKCMLFTHVSPYRPSIIS